MTLAVTLQESSSLYFEAVCVTGTWGLRIRLHWPARVSPVSSPVWGQQACATMLGFFLSAGDALRSSHLPGKC